MTEQTQPSPQPVEAQPSAQPSAQAAAPAPTLDDILNAYDVEIATPKPEPQAAPKPTTEVPPDKQLQRRVDPATVDWLAKNDPSVIAEYLKQPITEHDAHELRKQMGTVGAMMQHMQAQQVHQQAKADFDGLVGRANDQLKKWEVPVGDDFVRRWLISESQLNPQLIAAFDNRNNSAEHNRRYQRIERKVLERLFNDAKRQPDPEATADRYAVVAAMRGGTGQPAPDKPVKYGELSQAEFEKIRQEYS
jgi:hypothetical protein